MLFRSEYTPAGVDLRVGMDVLTILLEGCCQLEDVDEGMEGVC